jgi:hypothetical protein
MGFVIVRAGIWWNMVPASRWAGTWHRRVDGAWPRAWRGSDLFLGVSGKSNLVFSIPKGYQYAYSRDELNWNHNFYHELNTTYVSNS